jgi:hypothetical protein
MKTVIAKQVYLSLSQAAALLPVGRGGARIHPATLSRWILAGVRAPGGRRVRLAGLRCGSRWLTTEEALEQFMLDCAGPVAIDQPAPVRSPGQARRSHQRAEKQLAAAGI